MTKIFCFGEMLIRLSPSLEGKWLRDASLSVYAGGSELNCAIALSCFSLPVRYCSVIPSNYLTEDILHFLEEKNIDTSAVIFSGEKIGSYFLPQGSDLQHAGVIYDRAHSSFSSISTGMIDWNKVLDGCSWFHFSAISPALGENVAAVCLEALQAATEMGIKISVDLNYRSKLWKDGRQPSDVMPSLVKYCHVVMGNIWSAATMLNIDINENLQENKGREVCLSQARKTSISIMTEFNKCEMVANTFRFDQNGGINYFASVDTPDRQFASKELFTPSIVDKAGSGDCFMAGLIYGICNGLSLQETVDFASAAGFGKLQEKGDFTSQNISDVHSIVRSA